MLIIPVVDINQGLVVHAKQGHRKDYRPIVSKITANPEPEAVIAAFLNLYPFTKIYLADLDAIEGKTPQYRLISRLATQFSHCEFWLDAGLAAISDQPSPYHASNIKRVLGTEHPLTPAQCTALLTGTRPLILSLDFNGDGLINNDYLLNRPALWPQQLIIMMLHRVGAEQGVDFKQVNQVLARCQQHEVYVAGGITGRNMLSQLAAIGITGALVATALHNGSIDKATLRALNTQ